MSALTFAKLHATGNDFLVRVAAHEESDLDSGAVAALCDRHRGVGADGVITIRDGGGVADVTMRLVNADGGAAETSGNGLRCVVHEAWRAGLVSDEAATEITIATDAGPKRVSFERGPDGGVAFAAVEMGPASFVPEEIPVLAETTLDLESHVHGVTYRGDAVGMGNPHYVVFVDDVSGARVATHGPRLEHDDRFPHRTNVEFVSVESRAVIRMRVWERGVGETLSCGTGACAAVAAARRRGLVDSRVDVQVPGGALVVEIGETITLGGPVVHCFDVDVDPAALAAGGAGT